MHDNRNRIDFLIGNAIIEMRPMAMIMPKATKAM